MNQIIPQIGTPEWREARRRFVGGSEVAALFGLSPHTTRFQLWHQKAGSLPEADLSDDERIEAGNVLEPAIASWVAKRTGWIVEKVERHARHSIVEGMAASLDYAIRAEMRGPGALEIKNVDRLIWRGWEREEGERPNPPMAFELQLQHELACTGWTWGALGILVGGNQLEIYERQRHPAAIAKIEAEVAAFWQSIREGREPQVDFGADLETIKALHREIDGETVDLTASNRLPVLCAEYKDAGADEKAAKERKDAAMAEILTLIDSASVAVTMGWRIKSTIVPGAQVAFERKPYRKVTISEIKEK